MEARRLSPDELRAYATQGYMIYGPILEPDELGEVRTRVDDLIRHLPAGQRPESIEGPHNHEDFFLALASKAHLLDVVEQVLGPNIVLFGSTIIAKPGGDGKPVAWHQDTPLWPLTPPLAATLWLAVDDSTCENGCMQVIPGSHRTGIVAHEARDTETFVLGAGARDSDVDAAAAVNVELNAGQCSLHDPSLLHGSQANTSSKRRCGYVLHYTAAEARLDRSAGDMWADFPLYLLRGSDVQGCNRYVNVS